MEAAPCTARLAPDPSGPPIYNRSFAEGRPLRVVDDDVEMKDQTNSGDDVHNHDLTQTLPLKTPEC